MDVWIVFHENEIKYTCVCTGAVLDFNSSFAPQSASQHVEEGEINNFFLLYVVLGNDALPVPVLSFYDFGLMAPLSRVLTCRLDVAKGRARTVGRQDG